MRIAGAILVLACLAITYSYAQTQDTVADVVKRSSDAVVLIVVSDASGQEVALGSGFLVSADGEIVTNYHVIKAAHSASVKLSNGSFFPVSGVLASDADKDLAVIKVNGKNLPFLAIGEIEKLHVGDHVVAIGSPLGLEQTVSDGIVSAIRDDNGKRWVQTTAPASPGNSGGPLLDMRNEVVGVVTRRVDPGLGQNLNFAIPCSEVTTLLLSARQSLRPLEAATSASGDSFTQGATWTSLTTGHDYNLRLDGDYLYVDWVNIPTDVKTAGGFARSELKRVLTANGMEKTILYFHVTTPWAEESGNNPEPTGAVPKLILRLTPCQTSVSRGWARLRRSLIAASASGMGK